MARRRASWDENCGKIATWPAKFAGAAACYRHESFSL